MQKENCFSAWSCDVKTGSVTETANNLSIRTQDGKTAGLVDVGTRYALLVNADQSVAVLDLKTGYQSSAISGDLTIKYSDFFSEDLMEASETLDTADLFN